MIYRSANHMFQMLLPLLQLICSLHQWTSGTVQKYFVALTSVSALEHRLLKTNFEPFRDILNPSLPPQGFDSPPNILHPAYIISKVQPGAKFVAILRNPTDRLYSDWEFFNKAHDREKFHGLVVAALNDFNKCLSLVSWGKIRSRMKLDLV